MKHPARKLSYDAIEAGLIFAHEEGHVHKNVSKEGLHLYTYSETAVYNHSWTEPVLMARGLILDPTAKRVVATPFTKFFNVGEERNLSEVHGGLPDLPFEVYEKLDGSLIIMYFHRGKWNCATKGSFYSDQAKWAQKQLAEYNLSHLDNGTTYMAEAIYPENRIVVEYSDRPPGLYLLGAYDEHGEELSYESLERLMYQTGMGIADRYEYKHISELLEKAKTLPATSEGWVLRFSNGVRVKIKGDEYCRIHRIVSGLTPLGIWRGMEAGDDLEAIRKQLPEEFWDDFDTIKNILNDKLHTLRYEIERYAGTVAAQTDKEVGLRLEEFPESVRRFIFPYRKGKINDDRVRKALFEAIRPDKNILEGYKASSSINRVQDA